MHAGWLATILNLLGMGGGGSVVVTPRRICGLTATYREYDLAATRRSYDLDAAHREYSLTTEGCECC